MQAKMIVESRQCTDLALADVLDRVGQELKTLERSMEEMHPIVERLLAEVAPQELASIMAMQNIDRIEQTLSSLAQFLHAVAQSTPQEWQLDIGVAAMTVRLSDLAHRLSAAQDSIHYRAEVDAGECELL